MKSIGKSTKQAAQKIVAKDRNGERSEKRTEAGFFEDPPAYVTYGNGVTLNMGQFESLRVNISVTLPCDPKNVRSALAEAKREVSRELDAEVKKARG